MTIAPQKYFESSQDGVIPVVHKFIDQAAGAAASQVSAVAGKVIEVVSITCQTNNAARGTIAFYSGSGAGLLLWNFLTPTNAQDPFTQSEPINGLFRTLPGEALFSQAITQTQFCRISYRIFTLL